MRQNEAFLRLSHIGFGTESNTNPKKKQVFWLSGFFIGVGLLETIPIMGHENISLRAFGGGYILVLRTKRRYFQFVIVPELWPDFHKHFCCSSIGYPKDFFSQQST